MPVYACGVYKSAKERELRFLNAQKWEQKIENSEDIPFMTDWNKEELNGLMKFYREYFAKNLA